MALITCTTASFTCPEPKEGQEGARGTHQALCYACTHIYMCTAFVPTSVSVLMPVYTHNTTVPTTASASRLRDRLVWVPTPTPGPTPAVVPNTWLYRSLLSPRLAAF